MPITQTFPAQRLVSCVQWPPEYCCDLLFPGVSLFTSPGPGKHFCHPTAITKEGIKWSERFEIKTCAKLPAEWGQTQGRATIHNHRYRQCKALRKLAYVEFVPKHGKYSMFNLSNLCRPACLPLCLKQVQKHIENVLFQLFNNFLVWWECSSQLARAMLRWSCSCQVRWPRSGEMARLGDMGYSKHSKSLTARIS